MKITIILTIFCLLMTVVTSQHLEHRRRRGEEQMNVVISNNHGALRRRLQAGAPMTAVRPQVCFAFHLILLTHCPYSN